MKTNKLELNLDKVELSLVRQNQNHTIAGHFVLGAVPLVLLFLEEKTHNSGDTKASIACTLRKLLSHPAPNSVVFFMLAMLNQ